MGEMAVIVMPMFYFHVRTPADVIPDPEGSDLPDADHAEREAVTSAREIWAQGILYGEDRRDWAVLITLADGSVLRELMFGDTAEPNS